MSAEIIVTGASGFIGGALVRYLHAKGYDVSAWGRRSVVPPGHLPQDVKYISADLNDKLPKINAKWVVHCAGLAGDSESQEDLFMANVRATENLLDACSPQTSFVFISSGSVYPARNHCFREDYPIDPSELSAYGKSKLQAEDVCLNYAKQMNNLYILRPRAVYGKGDNQLLPRLKKLVKGKLMFVPGDGRNQISMCNIQNLCAAVEQIMVKEIPGRHIWNVCDPAPYELNSILKPLLEKLKSRQLQILHIPAFILFAWAYLAKALGFNSVMTVQAIEYMTKSIQLDTCKIQNELGFMPEKTFKDYLKGIY